MQCFLKQSGFIRYFKPDSNNGHEAGYTNDTWETELPPPSESTIISRFAVYHYADRPDVAKERQALDNAITDYVRVLQEDESLDPASVSSLLEEMGHEAELVYWLDQFVPTAFCRVLLSEIANAFPDTYYLAQQGGRLSEAMFLMRHPVFARAQVMGWHFCSTPALQKAFERAAFSSSEFNALNNALNEGSKLEDLVSYPSLIPDIGINQEDYDAASEACFSLLQKEINPESEPQIDKEPLIEKPWWKFWG